MTLNIGESKELTFIATVSADYSDDTHELLTPASYDLVWSTTSNITGISLSSEGKLTVSEVTELGSYEIPVKVSATLKESEISAEATKNINVTVNNVPPVIKITEGSAVLTDIQKGDSVNIVI